MCIYCIFYDFLFILFIQADLDSLILLLIGYVITNEFAVPLVLGNTYLNLVFCKTFELFLLILDNSSVKFQAWCVSQLQQC